MSSQVTDRAGNPVDHIVVTVEDGRMRNRVVLARREQSMKVQLGTVISGTLRGEDLIPAFIEKLDELKEALSLERGSDAPSAVREITRLDRMLRDMEARTELSDYWDEHGDFELDLTDLVEELTLLAPPYCFFGVHPGDGADFGFWVSIDAVERARRDEELPSGPQLPDSAEGEFLQISDHGNMELYVADTEGNWVSAWAVV